MNLSEVVQNLQMDSNTAETYQAQYYLKQHKEFRSFRSDIGDSTENVVDCHGSKVFYIPYKEVSTIYYNMSSQIIQGNIHVKSDRLKILASEIEKETDLICQLELLIRKNPERETKVSIRLIVQHLLYLSENMVNSREGILFMHNNTPLLALGCMLQSLKLSNFICFFATIETAAICHLFTELCRKAGLDDCKLVIANAKELISNDFPEVTYSNLFEELPPEVIGVITDKSDVDSAVEVFLNAEDHPFRLTRIIVQESIYKEFKDIMAWKCRSQESIKPSLKSNCMDAFKYGTKTICLDYAGTVRELNDQKDHIILVDAYRTTSELLNFLNESEKRLCLSLWASGISEANEIALNVTIPVIWINDYYNFDGPNTVSQAIFDKTYQYSFYRCYEEEMLQRLADRQKSWASLSPSKRYEIVVRAFNAVDAELGEAIKEKSRTYWKLDKYVSVANKTLVMGFTLPIPIFGFLWGEESNAKSHKQVWVDVAKTFINGSALACGVYDKSIYSVFVKLSQNGLPVADLDCSDITEEEPKVMFKNYPESYHTRVIWTSFGTTFAN